MWVANAELQQIKPSHYGSYVRCLPVFSINCSKKLVLHIQIMSVINKYFLLWNILADV